MWDIGSRIVVLGAAIALYMYAVHTGGQRDVVEIYTGAIGLSGCITCRTPARSEDLRSICAVLDVLGLVVLAGVLMLLLAPMILPSWLGGT